MANKRTELPVREMLHEPTVSMRSEAGSGDTNDRLERIAKSAYRRAASRGFIGGDPVHDWLQAELEIDSPIKGS